jgi:hypothetical protein
MFLNYTQKDERSLSSSRKHSPEFGLLVIRSRMHFPYIVRCLGVHTMTQLVEALRYKLGVAGSIPHSVIRIFHWFLPAALWSCSRLSLRVLFVCLFVSMGVRGKPWMYLSLAGFLYRPLWTFQLWPPDAPAPTDANLTTFICRLTCNLVTSTSWNPGGLYRHEKGLLYHLKIIFLKYFPLRSAMSFNLSIIKVNISVFWDVTPYIFVNKS